ncbi:MAG: cytosolic protein [Nitrospiraceae bacterium]|nr:cytosolic protein [Nitrospiraceae bacterium]
MANCPNESKNLARCNCSYPGCSKKSMCCECLHSHLASRQLPGCCFPDTVEKTFDRSFDAFIKAWS